MANPPRKLILFDIDGTLLLTGGAGAAAFNQVFRKLYKLENAWCDVHPDGRTDPSLIDELFEKNLGRRPFSHEMKAIETCYAEAMAQALPQSERFRLMPGVPELLALLSHRPGNFLGLATGNFETTAYQKLQHAGLRDYFSFGGFGSDHADRFQLTKLAVERGRQKSGGKVFSENIFLVGDSVHDIRCGQRLGIVTVAVSTGSTSRQELTQARPDFLLGNFTPLDEVALIFE